jgi:hypothetical protein
MQTFSIARRFCGPTGTANGGYFCGTVAGFARDGVTVRLVKPVPLETTLVVEHVDGLPRVRHDEHVIAEARPGAVGDLAPPAWPSHADAVTAAQHYAGFGKHPAPLCFVCGPQRSPGDALCIFAGSIAPGVVAAPWVPDASLADGRGTVRPELMWAALDCPGFAAVAPDMRAMLLGELTADVRRRAGIGEPCTVVGWQIASNGRKHEAGTALLGSDGELYATARAIWIEPRAAVQP